MQAGRLAAADEGPSAVADLLLRSLTAKDRVLLAAQQQAAQRQRQQRQQPEQAGEQQGEVAGGGAAAGMLGSAAAAAAAAADPASKVQRFRAEVQRLLDSVSALHPPRGGQQQEPLAATDSGSSLFGTGGSPAAASSSALGAGGSGRAAAAPGSGPGDSGSRNAATLSQLMTLFADSPLFRGGPVPGVQVLHRRRACRCCRRWLPAVLSSPCSAAPLVGLDSLACLLLFCAWPMPPGRPLIPAPVVPCLQAPAWRRAGAGTLASQRQQRSGFSRGGCRWCGGGGSGGRHCCGRRPKPGAGGQARTWLAG